MKTKTSTVLPSLTFLQPMIKNYCKRLIMEKFIGVTMEIYFIASNHFLYLRHLNVLSPQQSFVSYQYYLKYIDET
jgi:hypothetical protein